MAQNTRTVYWHEDAEMWYDTAKDADIRNLRPSDIELLQPNKSEWFTPPQRAEIEEMIDSKAPLDFTSYQWDLIKARIDKVLTDKIAPEYPAYFFHEDWLVTYHHLQQEILARQELSRRIAALELRRPWWKLW